MTTLKSRVGRLLIPALPIGRRTFDALRRELWAAETRWGNLVNPAFHLTTRRLRAARDLSINLGSGGRGLPGWVNVELRPARDTTLCLDIRRRLPFAEGSARRILAEHVVEHLDRQRDTPRLFAELHRVLAPGGVARIVVPDAGRFLEAYATGDPERWRALGWPLESPPPDMRTPMDVLNHIFHQDGEHLYGYDFETLALVLRDAGFADVRRQQFGESVDPELAIDQPNHAPYSLYVEAIR